MNTFHMRTWLPMLMAGVFALAHSATVRPRVLLVERLAAAGAGMTYRPRRGPLR
ncbi:hypothetical protein [Parasulfuritortus cantonensis]|uniref:hypothetical protein n=1 Tax=Parasulfuritortus cantonensis TaxID=2528202 RepID=UPI0014055728|nr:hypothetical protein [Parasulfuritortus cantonensis]